MRIVDLTHGISGEMPVYPGTKPPEIIEACTLEKEGFREKKLSFYSHTGTHMDAPAHILEGARTLDRYPVDHFIGRAVSIDLTHLKKPVIEVVDLVSCRSDIAACEFILLNTGWSRYWKEEEYFGRYPVLAPSAAQWLCGFGLKGVGVDTISVDAMDSAELSVHRVLLSREMVIIENLANLHALPEAPFLFSCLPLRIGDCDGSPVRAVAMIELS